MRKKQPQSQAAVIPQAATPDWNTFLLILAPQFISRDTNIIISREDETISFEIETVKLKEFQEHFDTVLQSSESLECQLSYQYREAKSPDSLPAEAEISERPCIENLGQAKGFMKTLFGVDTMEGRSDCSINFDNYFVNYENGVLISDPKKIASYSLAELGQKFLCAHLNEVSVHALRQIVEGKAKYLQAPSDDIMEAIQGEGFVKTCFYIVKDETDPKKPVFRMHFNIGRFLQLIYSPKVHIEEMAQSKTRLTISASHLLLYVKQLSRHGILFTVETKYGKISAHPLLLPHKENVEKPLAVFIVLDDSGSMEEYREKLFQNIISLIEKIALVAPKADIDLTLFSSRGEEKNYEGKAENFDLNCFRQPALSGKTALYQALSTPLFEMQKKLKTHNTMFVIFTDGCDNDSLLSRDSILDQISDIQKAVTEGDMPPKMYAIGCGEIDENVLNALAQTALHDEYIKLKSFKDLTPIIDGVEGFEYGRVMAEFRTTIEGIEETHTLPICLDGQPHVVRQVTIPLSSQPVQVSFKALTRGQELALSQVTLQITASQAQQTLESYEHKAGVIYADDTIAPRVKIAQLNGVLSEMNTFCTKAPQQIVLALQADLQKRIEGYNSILLKEQDALSLSESSTPRASSSSLGRDSPINSGIINRSLRVEEKKVSSPRLG